MREILPSFHTLVAVLHVTLASKQRSWLGPTKFIEGAVPGSRQQQGFTSCKGRLYVFGGLDPSKGIFDNYISRKRTVEVDGFAMSGRPPESMIRPVSQGVSWIRFR